MWLIKNKIDKKSIKVKLGIVLVFVVTLQALLSVAIILFMRIPNSLEDYSYRLFYNTVQNREHYLSNTMSDRWSDIENYVVDAQAQYNEFFIRGKELTQQDKLDYFIDTVDILTEMIQFTETTGAFIILDDAMESGDANSAIYISTESGTDITENSRTNLIIGDREIAKFNPLNILACTEESWVLGTEYSKILADPFYATTITDISEYWGHWQVSTSLSNSKEYMLTYSTPLRDIDGNLIGVIGVEVSQTLLYTLLPDTEISSNQYGYFISKMDNMTNQIVPFTANGQIQNSLFTVNKSYEIETYDTDIAQLAAMFSNSGSLISVAYEKLEVYDSNSPVYSDDLYLIGLTDPVSLSQQASELEDSLVLMVALSVIVGVIIAYVVGRFFARPIVRLSKKVAIAPHGERVVLKSTGISEIDELSRAIEQLNLNILDAAFKQEQIMRLMNVGVGSFEYKLGADKVLVSSYLNSIMHTGASSDYSVNLQKDVFFNELEQLKQNKEHDFEDTYKTSETPEVWHKITELSGETSTFGVVLNVTKDVLEKRALNYERDYDMLTGLYNRSAFRRYSMSVFTKENLKKAAVIMLDLDNLKYVNDTFGHDMGDTYIKTSARCIADTFNKNAVVGRMSGDEFFVFIYGFDEKSEILEYTDKLYQTLDIKQITLSDGTKFKVRMSGGISWYKENSSELDELIRYADFAMYEGKHTLKGELRQFDKEAYLSDSFMLSGKEELNRVLDNEFIEYAFQPIVCAKTGDIYAYEALMRPQSELLNSPVKLLQIAGAQSQLWKIEKITFFKTLSLYVKYLEQIKDAKLFINSVPNQWLKETEYEEFERLYSKYLSNIVVEIIETERLDDDSLQHKVNKILSWGAKIALDDYGAGYSNDLNLLNVNPYIVKIDRFIVEGIDVDINRQAMFAKIADFCKHQGIHILAEGIETKEQMEYLINHGVDFLQGYYISLPIEKPDFDNTEIKKHITEILPTE